jgi:hypothetical protein
VHTAILSHFWGIFFTGSSFSKFLCHLWTFQPALFCLVFFLLHSVCFNQFSKPYLNIPPPPSRYHMIWPRYTPLNRCIKSALDPFQVQGIFFSSLDYSKCFFFRVVEG